MPKFVYAPEGADPMKWEFDPMRLLSPEAMAIEKLTGMSFGIEWQEACVSGNMTAVHALLYVFLKRQNPTLKPDQVVFSLADIGFEADEEPVSVPEGLDETDPKEGGLTTT